MFVSKNQKGESVMFGGKWDFDEDCGSHCYDRSVMPQFEIGYVVVRGRSSHLRMKISIPKKKRKPR